MTTELPAQTMNEHLDPITGEPGSHPVATGLGAVAVGTIGMVAAGTVAGPLGIVAAAIGGALIGGYAGTAAGEVVSAEEAYWRQHHIGQWVLKQRGACRDWSRLAPTGKTLQRLPKTQSAPR